MKLFLRLFALVLLAGLAGCRNLGYNGHSMGDSSTPSTSQSEYVRNYDANGNPTVKPVAPASTSDPASPNYRGSQ